MIKQFTIGAIALTLLVGIAACNNQQAQPKDPTQSPTEKVRDRADQIQQDLKDREKADPQKQDGEGEASPSPQP